MLEYLIWLNANLLILTYDLGRKQIVRNIFFAQAMVY